MSYLVSKNWGGIQVFSRLQAFTVMLSAKADTREFQKYFVLRMVENAKRLRIVVHRLMIKIRPNLLKGNCFSHSNIRQLIRIFWTKHRFGVKNKYYTYFNRLKAQTEVYSNSLMLKRHLHKYCRVRKKHERRIQLMLSICLT